MLSRAWFTAFVLIVSFSETVDGQCAGSVLQLNANESFQDVASLNYPFNYGNNLNCIWRIQALNNTDAVRLEITDAVIEFHADCVYDYGEIFDGYNVSSTSLGKFCGTGTPNYVTSGNYMTILFVSDYSLSGRGFKARYKSGERSSLLDPEDSDSKIDAVIILGASIGAVVLVIVIMAVIFTYIQAKKAKEIRRNPHLRGAAATSRVEPFRYDYGPNDIWGPPPPPPYGDMYSSPLSPPPAYSEMDPNPLQEQQIPGCIMTENSVIVGQTVPNDQSCNNTSNTTTEQLAERSDCNANTRFIRSPNPASNPVLLQPSLNSYNSNTNSIRPRGQTRNIPTIRTLNTNAIVPPTTNNITSGAGHTVENRTNPEVEVNSNIRGNAVVPDLENNQLPPSSTLAQTSNPRVDSFQNQNTRRQMTGAPISNPIHPVNRVARNGRQPSNRPANAVSGQNNGSIPSNTLQPGHQRTPSDVSDISLPGEPTNTVESRN